MTPSPRMRISPSLSSFAFDAVDDGVEARERAPPGVHDGVEAVRRVG